MKNIRRLLAAALALCIMAGVIVWPEGIHKAQAEIMVDGDYEYKVLTDDGTIQITAYHGSEACLFRTLFRIDNCTGGHLLWFGAHPLSLFCRVGQYVGRADFTDLFLCQRVASRFAGRMVLYDCR